MQDFVGVCVRVGVRVGVPDLLGVRAGLRVGVPLPLPVFEGVGLPLALAVFEDVGVADGVTLGVEENELIPLPSGI